MHLKGKGIDPKLKLRADLHWSRTNGSFGGMNVYGGAAKDISGAGPYVFKFTPADKPDLRNFVLTAWLTPTGEWSDHGELAQYQIGKQVTAPTSGYRSPQVRGSNFLVEVYFKTAPGQREGVLIEKMRGAGYSLIVNRDGGVTFAVNTGEEAAELASLAKVNDGKWHHVIAEADRTAETLTLYVDGRKDVSGLGLGANSTLANDADVHVGGTPQGRCLAGTFEFARIALGTLADAKTTIEELYAWQFDGPFLRDWTGRVPADGKRDAGAIEAMPKM